MYLGIDTSNYTTSICALTSDLKAIQSKKLLNVKHGEKGLRQSDAVFQHTVNLPNLVEKLRYDIDLSEPISSIGVSSKPRNVDGSYMPCFLVGLNNAYCLSSFMNVPLYETSHQIGHILAILFGVNRLDLTNERFIALHLSGGTTEVLLVEPDNDKIIKAEIVAKSLDLKAGQAIDRAGVMLGLDFPCGVELDRLSLESEKEYKHRPTLRGLDISLSGIENKTKKLIEDNTSPEDTAKFVLTYLSQSILTMLEKVSEKYGRLPIVFSGGVSSNTILRQTIKSKFDAYFADACYSCDNAVGTAVYAYLKDRK